MTHNTLLVHAAPHPLKMASADFYVPIGLTVEQIINYIQPRTELQSRVLVFINGQQVPMEYWARVRPKVNAIVSLRVLPGKGKKNPLGMILSIAVMIAAPYMAATYGAAVGTALGVSTKIGGALVSAAVSVAGSLVTSAIAPPSKPKAQSLSYSSSQDSPALYIAGARNQMRPYSRVKRILGFYRVFPDLGGNTYTEFVGVDQYVRQLFIWGYGPLEISDLKIGDTDIATFSDVERQSNDGDDSDVAPAFTLYPSSVDQNDLSIALTYAGGWQQQTTPLKTVEIHCDAVFPNGLYRYNDKGEKLAVTVQLEFAISPVGAGTWTVFSTITATEGSTAAVRKTATVKVSEGQYDVRVRRLTADTTDTKIQDDVYWTAIRSFKGSQPIKHKGVAADALRMRATGQLNGTVELYNGLAKTVCLDWDKTSGTWIKRATNNPASLYRCVLQDRANKKPVPDERIDLLMLQDWHEFCEENGFHFNAVYDFETSVGEVLDDICAAGRAAKDRQDALYTVIIDRAQTVPRQHITQRNSWGYRYEVNYPDIPHAFRVPFINEENGYNPDECYVYADGYNEENAEIFEQIEFFGVTNYQQNWKLGREHIATAKLQPFKHIFNCDAEILSSSQRGSLIRFSHDVALVGLGAAYIRGLVLDSEDDTKTVGIEIDDEVSMESGKVYGIKVRHSDNTESVIAVETDVGTVSTLTFVSAVDKDAGPQIDDLIMFGERDSETIDLLIKSIRFSPDLTAEVEAVDYAPGIYAASQGTIPDFVSNITIPPDLTRPIAPIILSVQSDEAVMVRNADGSLSSRMVITMKNNNAGLVEPIVKYRLTGGGDFIDAETALSSPGKIIITGLEDGQAYDLRIYYRRPMVSIVSTNILSLPSQLNGIVFEGSTGDPDVVQNFRVSVVGNIAILTWDAVSNIDHDHYEIRFTPLFDGVTWGGAQIVNDKVSGTNYSQSLRIGTYLIRAVDKAGNYSPDFTATSTATAALESLNVVEILDEAPSFAGAKTNCMVDTGALQLTDPSLMTGIYEFSDDIDLGAVYTCRLSASVAAGGANLSDTMDTWVTLASVEFLSDASPSSWDVRLEISTTNDDPTGSPVWSDWAEVITGDYAFRAIKARLVLLTSDINVTPVVYQLSLSIDMPDRIEADDDIVVPVGGLSISFDPPFKKKRAITVAPQNMGATERCLVTAQSESGFHIEFFDNSGASISRTADWIAKGYGRVSV